MELKQTNKKRRIISDWLVDMCDSVRLVLVISNLCDLGLESYGRMCWCFNKSSTKFKLILCMVLIYSQRSRTRLEILVIWRMRERKKIKLCSKISLNFANWNVNQKGCFCEKTTQKMSRQKLHIQMNVVVGIVWF